MSLDLRNETPISLAAAARMLPPGRRGRPVSMSCVLRWVLGGVRLRSGEVVRLEASRMGGRWLTTVQALERFADRQTPKLDEEEGPVPRSPRQRASASELAERELTKLGI